MKTTGENSFILITGACGGLGRAFAFECARRGNLFLTARSAERLAALKADGKSTVRGIKHIDRGYYDFDEKLAALGAHIKRVNQ